MESRSNLVKVPFQFQTDIEAWKSDNLNCTENSQYFNHETLRKIQNKGQ